jgi:hypothetical protein
LHDVIAPPQGLAAPKVNRSAHVLLHQHIDRARFERCHHPVGAVEPIGKHHIARIERTKQLPKQRLFARVLALAGSHRPVQHRPRAQRQDRYQARQRKPQSRLLGAALRKLLLVARRIGH